MRIGSKALIILNLCAHIIFEKSEPFVETQRKQKQNEEIFHSLSHFVLKIVV